MYIKYYSYSSTSRAPDHLLQWRYSYIEYYVEKGKYHLFYVGKSKETKSQIYIQQTEKQLGRKRGRFKWSDIRCLICRINEPKCLMHNLGITVIVTGIKLRDFLD